MTRDTYSESSPAARHPYMQGCTTTSARAKEIGIFSFFENFENEQICNFVINEVQV